MFQCSLQTANDEPPKTFTFDGVYDQQSTTEQIYMDTVYPLVEVFIASLRLVMGLVRIISS